METYIITEKEIQDIKESLLWYMDKCVPIDHSEYWNGTFHKKAFPIIRQLNTLINERKTIPAL